MQQDKARYTAQLAEERKAADESVKRIKALNAKLPVSDRGSGVQTEPKWLIGASHRATRSISYDLEELLSGALFRNSRNRRKL
jgi:hypothetical protein